MILEQTSVSRANTFDHGQTGGCNLRFWFETVHDLKPDQDSYQGDGVKGHKLLADYLSTGAMPAKRVKMGKVVTAAILKGELPTPGLDLNVESRFDGQEQWRPLFFPDGQPVLDADGEQKQEWIPLNRAETFWHGGLPWDGSIDLTFRRGAIPSVWDHKFHADLIANPPLTANQLIKTIQLPIYVLSELRYHPDATRWEIAHHNVGKTAPQGSSIVRAVVHIDQVRERGEQIAKLVQAMKQVATAEKQTDVPFNRKSCNTWLGCPHQANCRAFKENKVQITPEDQAMFDEIDGIPTETEAPAAPPPVPAGPTPAELKAAAIAKAKADLAALEAETAPAPAAAAPVAPKRRTQIVDVETPAQIPDSAPAPAAATVLCGPCGVSLTPDNASKTQSGKWLHIGCPKNAAAPVLASDAPASKPALASEQPTPPAEPKKRTPKAPPPPPPAVTAPGGGAALQTVVTVNDPAAAVKAIERAMQPEPVNAALYGVTVHLEIGPKTLALLQKLFPHAA